MLDNKVIREREANKHTFYNVPLHYKNMNTYS